MEAKQAASIVALIAAAHPQWPSTPETVAVYRQMLSDVTYEQALSAVQDLIATEDRWPSVASIRRRIALRAGVLPPSPSNAWQEVSDAISNGGRSTLPQFSHPAIKAAVAAIGWWELCNTTNPSATRAHFFRFYDDASEEDTRRTLGMGNRFLALGGSIEIGGAA
jgi:hypothetical protein